MEGDHVSLFVMGQMNGRWTTYVTGEEDGPHLVVVVIVIVVVMEGFDEIIM